MHGESGYPFMHETNHRGMPDQDTSMSFSSKSFHAQLELGLFITIVVTETQERALSQHGQSLETSTRDRK